MCEGIVQVALDSRRVSSRIETLIELCRVQLELGGGSFERVGAQRLGALIPIVMIVPESPLVVGTLRGHRRLRRLWRDHWEVTPDEAHHLAVLRADLGEDAGAMPGTTRWAAEVAILDDRDGRGRRAKRRVL